MKFKNDYIYIISLIALSLLLRYLTMPGSDISYSFDTGNYILATDDYSIKDHRPHAPGYFLFVKMLEAASIFTKDAFSAFFLLSNLFIALSVSFLYLLVRKWVGVKGSFFLSLIFITNPIIWFYANIPETYSFDVLFSIAIVYVGVERKYSYLTLPFLALGAGVRISSGVLMIPIAIYLLYRAWKLRGISIKSLLLSLFFAIILFLLWFLPMISLSGGLSEWFSIIAMHNPFPDSREAFSAISILKNSFYVFLYIAFFIGAALISYIALFFSEKVYEENTNRAELIKTALIWLLPGLFFFIFYYYVKGYLLLLAGGFYLLLALPLVNRLSYSICSLPPLPVREGWGGIRNLITRRDGFAGIRNLITHRESWGKINFLSPHTIYYFTLISAIGIQLLYFFIFPYTDPGLDYHYKSLREKLSTKELIQKRIFSDLSFSCAQLEALDRRYNDVEKAILFTIKEYPDKVVLIDPSVNAFARSFQPKYPQTKFAEIPPVFDNNYQYFSGLDSKTISGFKEILENMIIISTMASDEMYFKDMKQIIKNINGITISIPKTEKKVEIFEKYLYLCK
jgi:hypothetical protein